MPIQKPALIVLALCLFLGGKPLSADDGAILRPGYDLFQARQYQEAYVCQCW